MTPIWWRGVLAAAPRKVLLLILVGGPVLLRPIDPSSAGFLKPITLPMRIHFWAIGKTVQGSRPRSLGRRVYPVRVER